LSDNADFKRLTSGKIIETFAKSHRVEENGCWIFSKACEHVKKNKNIKVWQNGYHAAYL
jgi:EAL domain-containing protein (putative c-di-GMP-specific phosphodiesterase class I)